MKKAFLTLLGIVVLLSVLIGIIWVAVLLLSWFRSLQSDVAIGLLAGSVTILTSTIAIVLGRYFESKRDREAAHRDKKVVLYDEFTTRLFKLFRQEDADTKNQGEFIDFLREVQRKLILWSSPKVVTSYANWHKVLTANPEDPKAAALIGMVDFFLSLREDLGLSNKGIQREHIVRFLLQNPDLIMKMYSANKEVSFAEIIRVEERLKQISQSDNFPKEASASR